MTIGNDAKAYCITAIDDDGKLIAAEFIEGLPIEVLDAIEHWTDQCCEFRIKRVLASTNAPRLVSSRMSMVVELDTPKTKVRVVADKDGSVTITHTPRDFAKNGASEVDLGRTRRDDGSVDITIRPK